MDNLTQGVNPLILKIYRDLLNPSASTEAVPIDETKMQGAITQPPVQPGWLQSILQRVLNAGRAGVPPLNILDLISIQRRQPGEFPVSVDFGKPSEWIGGTSAQPLAEKPSAPLPEWLVPQLEPEAAPKPTTPAKRALPTTPSAGTPVGSPLYALPNKEKEEVPTVETPSETILPTTVSTTAATAEKPDFGTMIKPWKAKVDYEKELMDIFSENFPKYEDLPKSKYKKPETPGDYLSEFLRLTGWALAGKDPYTLVKGEEKEAEAKADKERNYFIQRASQLANIRISALTEKVKKEEAERANQASWLEYVGNAQPEIRRNPQYQAAVASIRGVDPADATKLLDSLVDPKTGQLTGMYLSEEEKAIKQQEALNNYKHKKMVEAGFSPERATFAIATGSIDMGAFLMTQYQNAKTPIERAKAEKDIQDYRKLQEYDPLQSKAIAFLANRDVYKKLFTDSTSFKYFNDWATAVALLGKDAPKPPLPKEITVKEEIARDMLNSLGDSKREADFAKKHGISAKTVFDIYMGNKEHATGVGLPEPFATIQKMAPDIKSDKLPNISGEDAYGSSLRNAAKDIIVRKYAPLFMEVSKILPKNAPLTDDEVYKIATAANTGDSTQVQSAIVEIYNSRGIQPKK